MIIRQYSTDIHIDFVYHKLQKKFTHGLRYCCVLLWFGNQIFQDELTAIGNIIKYYWNTKEANLKNMSKWINSLRPSDVYMHLFKLTIFGSDNGLLPGRCLANIWTNARILLNGPIGTNFSEILNENHIFSFKEMHFKMSSVIYRPFWLGLNVLNELTGEFM